MQPSFVAYYRMEYYVFNTHKTFAQYRFATKYSEREIRLCSSQVDGSQAFQLWSILSTNKTFETEKIHFKTSTIKSNHPHILAQLVLKTSPKAKRLSKIRMVIYRRSFAHCCRMFFSYWSQSFIKAILVGKSKCASLLLPFSYTLHH